MAVLRVGLKNGVRTTVAPTKWRVPSTVISNRRRVPSALRGVSMHAIAIRRFSVGDHVVVVALPTCRSPYSTGTGVRDAAAGATGGKPTRS